MVVAIVFLATLARGDELTVIEITVAYPGHGAAEVEAQLATPIERALSQMASLEDVWSESRAGVTKIWASLPRADALPATRAALRQALPALPADLPAPPSYAELPSDAPAVVFVVAPPSPAVETIGERVATVPGTARVSLCGVARTETQAKIDPGRLAARGLTVADVLAKLRAGDPFRLEEVAVVEKTARTDCTARSEDKAVSLGEVRFRRGAPAGAREEVLAALRKAEPTPTILPEGSVVHWTGTSQATIEPKPPDEFALEVISADREALKTAVGSLASAAAGPEIAQVSADDAVEPALELAVDRELAARLGVRAEDAWTTFAATRDGVLAGGVRVVAPGEPQELLVPAGTKRVRLGAVAQLRRTAAPAVVRHGGLFPSVTLRLRPRRPFSLLDAVRVALRLEAAVPANVRIRFRA